MVKPHGQIGVLRPRPPKLVELRVDKPWRFNRYRLTAMADVYTVLKVQPGDELRREQRSRFEDVIEWLPGQTLKLGLRLQS